MQKEYIPSAESMALKELGFDYRIDYFDGFEDSNTLETYEEAELECLKKLIEIVKNDKENK